MSLSWYICESPFLTRCALRMCSLRMCAYVVHPWSILTFMDELMCGCIIFPIYFTFKPKLFHRLIGVLSIRCSYRSTLFLLLLLLNFCVILLCL